MKAIRKRLYRFAAMSLFFMVLFIFILLQYAEVTFISITLCFIICITICSMGFFLREYKKLKIARLIEENQILHIRPAVIDAEFGCNVDIEVFISCFGILIDSKVIKFNYKAKHLKSVEIGQDYIDLSYGTDTYTKKTKILHELIDGQSIARIAEQIRFETGVVPRIINMNSK